MVVLAEELKIQQNNHEVKGLGGSIAVRGANKEVFPMKPNGPEGEVNKYANNLKKIRQFIQDKHNFYQLYAKKPLKRYG